MPVTTVKQLLTTTAALRGCPCGARVSDSKGKPTMSVLVQVTTIGVTPRLRARAINLHMCARCVRLIHTKAGRKLRQALAGAVIAQAVDLARQKRGSDAA